MLIGNPVIFNLFTLKPTFIIGTRRRRKCGHSDDSSCGCFSAPCASASRPSLASLCRSDELLLLRRIRVRWDTRRLSRLSVFEDVCQEYHARTSDERGLLTVLLTLRGLPSLIGEFSQSSFNFLPSAAQRKRDTLEQEADNVSLSLEKTGASVCGIYSNYSIIWPCWVFRILLLGPREWIALRACGGDR